MSADDISQLLLDQHGMRISDSMNQYILKLVNSSKSGEIPVIGGDARTGIPLRAMIPLDSLRRALDLKKN